MIDHVHFERFKSLYDVSLDLGRLTVLVGPNGSGKSSVLEAIHLLSRTGLRTSRAKIWEQTFSGPQEPQRIASPGRPTKMRLTMGRKNAPALSLAVAVPEPSRQVAVEFEVWVDGLKVEPRDPRVKEYASAVYLHLDAQQMRRTSVPLFEVPHMGANGSGLASTLAWMKGAAEDEIAEITRDLARVVPGVRRILTKREEIFSRDFDQIDVAGQPVWRPVDNSAFGDRFEIEFMDGNSVPADLLSEGTVLALGLLTKLHEPSRPRLVLLDDIDRGLHIEAQTKLVEVLRDMLANIPDLQIVCTTHSPYLLDLFKPEEVRVLALDEQRHTHALALTQHPEFDQWKFGTQTGELWAALGSAWVATKGSKP